MAGGVLAPELGVSAEGESPAGLAVVESKGTGEPGVGADGGVEPGLPAGADAELAGGVPKPGLGVSMKDEPPARSAAVEPEGTGDSVKGADGGVDSGLPAEADCELAGGGTFGLEACSGGAGDEFMLGGGAELKGKTEPEAAEFCGGLAGGAAGNEVGGDPETSGTEDAGGGVTSEGEDPGAGGVTAAELSGVPTVGAEVPAGGASVDPAGT